MLKVFDREMFGVCSNAYESSSKRSCQVRTGGLVEKGSCRWMEELKEPCVTYCFYRLPKAVKDNCFSSISNFSSFYSIFPGNDNAISAMVRLTPCFFPFCTVES